MNSVLEPPCVVVASPAMKELLLMAERAAASSAKVLITGESGVGKDVVARHLHCHSSRKLAPFVAVNCAGLTETLLESELFGHVKGSFTGAYPRQARQASARASRHALSRRSRRDEPADAGVVAALPRERRDSGGRIRSTAGTRRCARGGCHQSQPERARVGGAVPGRPPLPAERDPAPGARSARTSRGRTRVDDALPRSLRAPSDLLRRRASRVHAIPMAGQRPRADQRRGTAAMAVDGRVVGVEHLPPAMRTGPR